MNEFDGRGDINDVLNALAAERQIRKKRDHRPHPLAAAVD
jgi:hypothetical protein